MARESSGDFFCRFRPAHGSVAFRLRAIKRPAFRSIFSVRSGQSVFIVGERPFIDDGRVFIDGECPSVGDEYRMSPEARPNSQIPRPE